MADLPKKLSSLSGLLTRFPGPVKMKGPSARLFLIEDGDTSEGEPLHQASFFSWWRGVIDDGKLTMTVISSGLANSGVGQRSARAHQRSLAQDEVLCKCWTSTTPSQLWLSSLPST